MDEMLDQPEPREDLIRSLRQMAARGTTVRELVQEIHNRLGFKKDVILPVLWYFTRAFQLSLLEVLPLREWIGTDEDEEIDAVILPAIARTRGEWDRDPIDVTVTPKVG